MGRDTRETATELRAVAPLIITGAKPQLVGVCTLVTNGAQTIAFSSAELLRNAGEPLGIALTLDGSRTLPVASWTMGRSTAMGIIELGQTFPKDGKLDVQPLPIGGVYATVDTRGAPSALVTVIASDGGYERRVVSVQIDAIDGGGMSDDVLSRLASPIEPGDIDAVIEGAALFSWMPPDPVLGRPSEVVLVALATKYRARTFKPRALPPLAELTGLEELARFLPFEIEKKEGSNELGQVAGEIGDAESGPLAGLDVDESGPHDRDG